MNEDQYIKCEHCLNPNDSWQLEILPKTRCSILNENEIYLICDYCIEVIEGEGEGQEEVQYWNEWVMNKRLLKE
ncbi:hypothetical protein T458_22145 [Brevibacillus panacihumi W25]|uniref:Uncharacterized protein n=1 Tax=Brevibacillus panacihumi W25 TaxID=1408254 RepID=V6M6M9_9BACL|nr:hypothetical protein [Brevibacillus panacihumi]EST53952.1 hypothetical protein T458_22145 [Brevibacillus panacihumi W25]